MGHFELKLASPWPRVVSVIALPSRTAHPPLTISIKFKTKSHSYAKCNERLLARSKTENRYLTLRITNSFISDIYPLVLCLSVCARRLYSKCVSKCVSK